MSRALRHFQNGIKKCPEYLIAHKNVSHRQERDVSGILKEKREARRLRQLKLLVAGLGLFDQKNVIAVTMPIVTAFKFCVGHRKNGLLNR